MPRFCAGGPDRRLCGRRAGGGADRGRLAETGAELETCYSQQICTPSRAALMTGRYPMRYGLQTGAIPSGGRYGLATDEWPTMRMAVRSLG